MNYIDIRKFDFKIVLNQMRKAREKEKYFSFSSSQDKITSKHFCIFTLLGQFSWFVAMILFTFWRNSSCCVRVGPCSGGAPATCNVAKLLLYFGNGVWQTVGFVVKLFANFAFTFVQIATSAQAASQIVYCYIYPVAALQCKVRNVSIEYTVFLKNA